MPGEVFLQTRTPDHYAVRAAGNLDYDAFAEEELSFRQEMSYPPYVRLVMILVRSRQEERAEKSAEELMGYLENRNLPSDVQLLGPVPSFHHKRAGFVQWQVIVKGAEPSVEKILSALRGFTVPKGISLVVNADPEELD